MLFLRILLVGFLFCLTNGLAAEDKPIRVSIFFPSDKADTFWNLCGDFSIAVAKQLNINISIYYADRNHYKMIEQLNEVLSQNEKPDAVMFQSQKMNGGRMLSDSDNQQVLAFLFNAGLNNEQVAIHGKPREKHKHWIGEMLPNDEQAGFDLLNILVDLAKKEGKMNAEGKVEVLAINGALGDGATIERGKGFDRAIKARKDISFSQMVNANWDRKKATELYSLLTHRYPDIKVVWASNDPMGLGVIDDLKSKKLIPAKDVFVGGVDWTQDGLKAIKNNELSVSMGGHFMEPGWVLILLYDYLKGIDFIHDDKIQGQVSLRSVMTAITAENIDTYLKYFEKNDWDKIDFKQFSKHLNPQLKTYEFTLDAILKQMKNRIK